MCDYETLLAKLHHLGFTEYEAKVYLALLRSHPATGYQVSKNSGVPRSMVYQTLQKLINKKAVFTLLSRPVTYSPVAPEEVIGNMKKLFLATADGLMHDLRQAEISRPLQYAVNISGSNQVLRRAREMIIGAKKSLVLAADAVQIKALTEELLQAQNRGLDMNLLVYGNLQTPFSRVYQHPQGHREQIFAMVADAKEVLVAEALAAHDLTGMYAQAPGVVLIVTRFIKSEMFMARKPKMTIQLDDAEK